MSTPRDRLILNAIINPLLPLGEGVFDEEQSLPADLKDNEPETDVVKWVTDFWPFQKSLRNKIKRS